jgi:hypothetical protein
MTFRLTITLLIFCVAAAGLLFLEVGLLSCSASSAPGPTIGGVGGRSGNRCPSPRNGFCAGHDVSRDLSFDEWSRVPSRSW